MPRDAYRQEVQLNFQVPPYPNRQILGHIQPAQIGQNQFSHAMRKLEQPARVMSDFGWIDVPSIQGIAANDVDCFECGAKWKTRSYRTSEFDQNTSEFDENA